MSSRRFQLASARFAIAAILMLAWLAWTRRRCRRASDALRIFLCGLAGIALYNFFLNTGQQTVAAGAASFIVNSAPILTALLALVFLGERFTVWGWIGTVVSFCGIGVIASGQPGGLSFGAGSIFILCAAVCTGSYFVLQKPLVAKYGAMPCAAYTMLIGALLLSPWLPKRDNEADDGLAHHHRRGCRARGVSRRARLRDLDLCARIFRRRARVEFSLPDRAGRDRAGISVHRRNAEYPDHRGRRALDRAA